MHSPPRIRWSCHFSSKPNLPYPPSSSRLPARPLRATPSKTKTTTFLTLSVGSSESESESNRSTTKGASQSIAIASPCLAIPLCDLYIPRSPSTPSAQRYSHSCRVLLCVALAGRHFTSCRRGTPLRPLSTAFLPFSPLARSLTRTTSEARRAT